MKFNSKSQNTELNLNLADCDAIEIDGILYFTIDLGIRGKQRWKTDGTPAGTVFVSMV